MMHPGRMVLRAFVMGVVLLCFAAAPALANEFVGVNIGGGHHILGARAYIERDNPSPISSWGSSSAWPMILDSTVDYGSLAQIGYAKSPLDWGDNRVHYFYEYEDPYTSYGAVQLGTMPANYTGVYDHYCVYLNQDDGEIHFVLNGSLKQTIFPTWTSDAGEWLGEIRNPPSDHFPGDPGHKVDFLNVQRFYGSWYDINANANLWHPHPELGQVSVTGDADPNFKIWDTRSW